MTVIVDYDCGNIKSIANMAMKLGHRTRITSDVRTINSAEKLILPGVGHFGFAMQNLVRLDLKSVLDDHVHAGKPILGICLGAQLMTKWSEESNSEGFGWVEGHTERFVQKNEEMRIPHMGWNTITPRANKNVLTSASDQDRFYFAHSYYIAMEDENQVASTTEYGTRFVSAFENKSVQGVQFHPEKSHKFGMKILRNFLDRHETTESSDTPPSA